MQEYTLQTIEKGISHSLSVKLTEDMLTTFAHLTGDMNPLHTDDDFARQDGFPARVAHGMLVLSFYSTLVGMYLPGRHGRDHRWLNTLSPAEQRAEVEASLDFLASLGVSADQSMMCYPYGAHDQSLRQICAELGCGLAVTTEFEIAELNQSNALMLARLDTNHLPKDAGAEPNKWTQRVLEEAT